MSELEGWSNAELEAEASRIETAWDRMIVAGKQSEAQAKFSDRFREVNGLLKTRREQSAVAVVRLRFLAGESGRKLDAACGEALGWRVGKDPWWNWHEGPRYDPPGDEWCIRKDARNDMPCNEALPHFTAESFEQTIARTLIGEREG